MKKFAIVALIFLFVFMIQYVAGKIYVEENNVSVPKSKCTIISLSPAVTEIVFLLGLEKNLIGVTRYCEYPPEAKPIKKIGGYYDPNLEEITRLNPAYVIVGTEHKLIDEKLRKLNINTVMVDNSSPENILNSILTIGKKFGRENIAYEIVTRTHKRMDLIRDLTKEVPKPKVMVVFGQDMAGEEKNKMYIIGKDTFYNPLIELAGGENIVRDSKVPYPLVTTEGVMQLNPDVIVELHSRIDSKNYSNVDKQWINLSHVNAVKNGRIFVMNSDYAFIPGPRFIKIAGDFLRFFHPQLESRIK